MIHTVYICCFFRFGASPKKLFVSFCYHVLFACLDPMVFKVNTANIQYFPIILDIQIMQDPPGTATWTTVLFHDYSYQKYGLFLSFLGLILWLKVYVAFNDLHNLTILLCECKMSFEIGSLRCEIHWEKTNTVSRPFSGGGDKVQYQILKRDKKMSALGDWKSPFYIIFAWMSYCVSCQKRL